MSSRVSKWRQTNAALAEMLNTDLDDRDLEDSVAFPVNEVEFPVNEVEFPVNEVEMDECLIDVDDHTESEFSEGSYNSEQESNSSGSDSEINDDKGLLADLAHWAVLNNVPHSALNGLLKIMRKHVDKQLPSDARTLLHTPRTVNIESKCSRKYLYRSLVAGISKQEPGVVGNKVNLIVNVDGLPISKSSEAQVWPVLGKVNDGKPFIIALFPGVSKPSSATEFMKDFLLEMSALTENSVMYRNQRLEFQLKCFTCDTPARAFLKAIKGHTGYNACERCQVVGEVHNHVMTFPETTAPLRNDAGFEAQHYHEHQHERSVLCNYQIPCVSKFVLDYMHLICLGVVKRFLSFLKSGPRICKLSQQQIQLLSDRLNSLRNSLPNEFARQPRSLQHLKRWKATEFRQFLLYTGIFVLKGVVTDSVYQHFLTLHVAVSIMMSYDPANESHIDLLNYAKELLKFFVDESPELYGSTFVVYNVHSIIHLPQDVEQFQCGLHELSAFPFENFMQLIKKMLRKGHQALSQIARRLSEMENVESRFRYKNVGYKISSVSNRNAWFLLKNDKICKVKEVADDGTLLVKLVSIHRTMPFFEKPLDSKILKICYVPNHLRFQSGSILKSEIKKKFVALSDSDGILLIPMNHDF